MPKFVGNEFVGYASAHYCGNTHIEAKAHSACIGAVSPDLWNHIGDVVNLTRVELLSHTIWRAYIDSFETGESHA